MKIDIAFVNKKDCIQTKYLHIKITVKIDSLYMLWSAKSTNTSFERRNENEAEGEVREVK